MYNDYDDDRDHPCLREYEEIKYGCLAQLIGFLIGIALVMLCVSLTSCSAPKTITNTVTQHDTLRVVNLQHDSIRVHDSVYVERWMQGDTCYLTKYIEHTAYKDRLRIDTVYKVRTDSISSTRIQMVEKKLTWWQKTQIYLGDILLVILCFGIGMLIMKIRRLSLF